MDMLSPQDVSVDSHISPSYITVIIRRSKNDPFAVGAKLHLGRTGLPLCPVSALLCYLAIRPPQQGPLFLFKDDSTFSRPRLVISLRKALSEVGVDPSGYNGHSFRIGAATTAARMGVNDSLIQTLGRWKSSAFVHYIRTPWEQLVQVSSLLAD